MHELLNKEVNGVSFGRNLGPADVKIMLMNVPEMAGEWMDTEIVSDDLDRWMRIDILRCC